MELDNLFMDLSLEKVWFSHSLQPLVVCSCASHCGASSHFPGHGCTLVGIAFFQVFLGYPVVETSWVQRPSHRQNTQPRRKPSVSVFLSQNAPFHVMFPLSLSQLLMDAELLLGWCAPELIGWPWQTCLAEHICPHLGRIPPHRTSLDLANSSDPVYLQQ